MGMEEVSAWVKEGREKGFSDDDFRRFLKAKGYPDALIENLLMNNPAKKKKNLLLLIFASVLGILLTFGLIMYLISSILLR